MYLRYELWAELISYADFIAAQKYADKDQHFLMNQLAALIRKYQFEVPVRGLNPDLTAWDTFLSAERRCKRVNRLHRRLAAVGDRRFGPAMERARSWIQYVIGEEPDVNRIYAQCDFGGGANVGVAGNATNVARKLCADVWSCTPTALYHALPALWENFQVREIILGQSQSGRVILSHDPHMFSEYVRGKAKWVNYNKIAFVAKTAKTSRTVAAEPVLNSFLQKGVDNYLRQLLQKRAGLNLRNQVLNQELAFKGSLEWESEDPWVTIDLSSASDLLAIEVVRRLVPPKWFRLMDEIRSPSYLTQNGKDTTRYEKFVSMGNGFCFPLETLIFASLCHAIQPGKFRVYGDDIIVRRSASSDVLKLLRHLGMKPNPKKTCITGPFRESCGADYFAGENVRPIEFKKPLDSLSAIFDFYNGSIRKGLQSKWYHYFAEVRGALLRAIPRNLRFMVPYDVDPDPQERFYEASPVNSNRALWASWDMVLCSPYSVYDKRTQCWKFLALNVRAVPDVVAIRSFKGTALEGMAVLRGASSSVPFALRYSTETKLCWL